MKNESPIGKLSRLVSESEQIRHGNLSGKKKSVAKKMSRAEQKGNKYINALRNSQEAQDDHKSQQAFEKKFGTIGDRIDNFKKR